MEHRKSKDLGQVKQSVRQYAGNFKVQWLRVQKRN